MEMIRRKISFGIDKETGVFLQSNGLLSISFLPSNSYKIISFTPSLKTHKNQPSPSQSHRSLQMQNLFPSKIFLPLI